MKFDKLYIAVLDDVPDYIVPTLVAHSVLNAHLKFQADPDWVEWLANSFRKCVVRVGRKEFDRIAVLDRVHLGHENRTLDGQPSCIVVCPRPGQVPNVLQFAKLWSPRNA